MRDGLGDLLPSRAVARRMLELETELKQARAYRRRHSKSPETLERWGLEKPEVAQQEEGWFITYLDMMTLLLVVMIVMLAFAGTLGDRAATTPAPEPVVTAALVQETPADSAPSPAVSEDAPLPGGDGLLPAQAALIDIAPLPDTALLSEPLPGWTARWGIPSAPRHPADVGPLPRDTLPTVDSEVPSLVLPPVPSPIDSLYPGWSAEDLLASFIGPPRPSNSVTVAETSESSTEAIASVIPEPAATPDPVEPSEGESVAASLSLGELGNDVQVVINERSVSFRVNSEILFDSSKSDLSRSGLSVLRRIVAVLADTDHEITVEGHTDSVPVRRNARFPSNWELSSARAGSVVRYLQANGIDRSRLKAVGYADTRPLGDNNTPAGRASNRRVELLIEKRD